jgi:hypothetical protein
MTRYRHEELDEEVRFISGSYSFIEEARLPYHGRDVLYVVGVAHVDNSCCGVTGCLFIRVPGYVIAWKDTTDDTHRPVSTITPIKDTREQTDIKRILGKNYPHSVIEFE